MEKTKLTFKERLGSGKWKLFSGILFILFCIIAISIGGWLLASYVKQSDPSWNYPYHRDPGKGLLIGGIICVVLGVIYLVFAILFFVFKKNDKPYIPLYVVAYIVGLLVLIIMFVVYGLIKAFPNKKRHRDEY